MTLEVLPCNCNGWMKIEICFLLCWLYVTLLQICTKHSFIFREAGSCRSSGWPSTFQTHFPDDLHSNGHWPGKFVEICSKWALFTTIVKRSASGASKVANRQLANVILLHFHFYQQWWFPCTGIWLSQLGFTLLVVFALLPERRSRRWRRRGRRRRRWWLGWCTCSLAPVLWRPPCQEEQSWTTQIIKEKKLWEGENDGASRKCWRDGRASWERRWVSWDNWKDALKILGWIGFIDFHCV